MYIGYLASSQYEYSEKKCFLLQSYNMYWKNIQWLTGACHM